MKSAGRSGDGKTAADRKIKPPEPAGDDLLASAAAQSWVDSDQTSADADQTASDADATASEKDQASADSDQRAADRDQATADRDRAADPARSAENESAYEASRNEREMTAFVRFENQRSRAEIARDRDETARHRDRIAAARDDAGRARDARIGTLTNALDWPAASMTKQLFRLSLEAADDRAKAAEDRERAAADRANAFREKTGLEKALRSAHLDELTGAYRREMGRMALNQEIDRARRADRRLVVAFVDVDGLKEVNDRNGHAAGDRVLQTVVSTIRARLRSFDPIIRYGGDEFVCGLGGTTLAEARRRFNSIGVAIEADAGVGISVGLVALAASDTADRLTERADAAMLVVKSAHHAKAQIGFAALAPAGARTMTGGALA
jgi:diguanylate cyclase (GGDEF)-like protein